MLRPKQKAYLKSLAHHLKPVYQIGKDGISDELIDGILDHLLVHELMKVNILNNSMVTFDEASEAFESVGIEVVQKIGHILVLYKASDRAKNPIVIPD